MDESSFRRFQAKYTVLSNECWGWTAAKSGRGGAYGTMRMGLSLRLAHRLSYEHFKGPIPEGLTIDHLCKNPACVNPMHLEAVTDRENNLRGNSISVQNANKTHCINGHEFTPKNTYMELGKYRHCRTCHRIHERKRKERIRNGEL